MGGGKSGGEQEVNEYYMAMHMGFCSGPIDAYVGLQIGEKVAWEGEVTTQSIITVSKRDLFGGPKKEGGVAGNVHFLPGGITQTLSDFLAAKLGRGTGANCPGFRGLTSLFFTGPDFSGGSKGLIKGRGFYWTANNPYLRTVWAAFRRAPRGLNPAYALIPRIGSTGSSTSGYLTTVNLNAITNATKIESEALSTKGITISGLSPVDVLTISMPLGQTYTASFNDRYFGFYSTGFRVIMDSDPSRFYEWVSGPYNTAEEARAAFPGVTLSGASTYTFYIWDDFVSDNSGGVSLYIDKTNYNAPDANPAHMIYECLTNTDWGMGAPSTIIDTDAFEAAGITLYDERLGLSMIWTRQTTIEAFVTEILDHIQATLFVNPRTGLITIKLMRDDYDVATLREITIDNAKLSNFQRKAWGEIANEVTVTWTNPENEQEETVTAQDLAGIATQGTIIPSGRNYYGVRTSALAMILASRDLRMSAAPIASLEAELDRSAWDLLPGEVVKVTWAEHGLSSVVMRVGPVDYGKPGQPTIRASLLEDIFSFSSANYSEPPSSGWNSGGQAADAMDYSRVITIPAFFAARLGAAADAAYPEVAAGILASTDNSDAVNYDVLGSVVQPDGTTVDTVLSTNTILGHATLTDPLVAEAESLGVTYSGLVGNVAPDQNVFVFIGGDATDETDMEVGLITLSGTDPVLKRGLLDTTPKDWPAGTVIWFVSTSSRISDNTIRSDGEGVTYKLLMRTSLDVLDSASAPTLTGTLFDRPYLPNRPANVQIDGVSFNTLADPVDMSDRADPWVTVTWANRNRLLEDSQLVWWTDATMTPETGQVTKIRVLSRDGATVLATHDDLAGTSFDIPDASFGTEDIVIVEVGAKRVDSDGTFESMQAHRLYVRVKDTTFDETIITFDNDLTPTWDDD